MREKDRDGQFFKKIVPTESCLREGQVWDDYFGALDWSSPSGGSSRVPAWALVTIFGTSWISSHTRPKAATWYKFVLVFSFSGFQTRFSTELVISAKNGFKWNDDGKKESKVAPKVRFDVWQHGQAGWGRFLEKNSESHLNWENIRNCKLCAKNCYTVWENLREGAFLPFPHCQDFVVALPQGRPPTGSHWKKERVIINLYFGWLSFLAESEMKRESLLNL